MTNVSGFDFDSILASKPSPLELELEQALMEAHARIAELESRVSTLETELSKKRQTEASVPTSNKKIKMVSPLAKSKRFVCSRLKANIKKGLKDVKFYPGLDSVDRRISVTDVLSEEEFIAVFGDYGKLIQPTPENKPNSVVTVKQLDSDDLVKILGSTEFKGELWTKGGQVQGSGFFIRAGFSKSNKINGGCQVVLRDAQVKYSGNNGKLLLKCTFVNKTLFNDSKTLFNVDCDVLF